MCFCWSSLSMDLFNNVWDMMQRSAPKIFCMTQDPAAWFSSAVASLDCTSISSLPQREKRLEDVKKIGTYHGSNALGPDRDRTLYISVSDLIFYGFSLYVIYFSFSSPMLSLHTKKCFSFISLILRIFVWTWKFCKILVRFGSFLQKGRSSPNLFISIQAAEHVIHVSKTQMQFILRLHVCQGRGWSPLGGLFSLD